jgi:CRISPR-associated endonuclease Cas1
VRIDRGHLVLEDGVGLHRRRGRFARVGHGLRRVVVISADGFVSLAALRWLTDQRIAFVMLDRNGAQIMSAGPSGTRDARLRRAQSVSVLTGAALPIVQAVIVEKLRGQEAIAREVFHDDAAAQAIAARRGDITSAFTAADLRLIESRAALAYWTCWRSVRVVFPTNERPRVPEHWQVFGVRISPLTGSPRVAVNPANAMLNYLYAMLEAEARLAAIAVGLDPGLGLMHADTPTRDSLATDLMEAVRPQVDAYVLRWLTQHTLRREWFFEERNGNCRLMASFVERLSETAPTWARAVAPVAEQVAKGLWATTRRSTGWRELATPLTQRHRRAGKRQPDPLPPSVEPAAPPRVCQNCGIAMRSGHQQCRTCHHGALAPRMLAVAKEGRKKSRLPEARAKHSQTKRRQDAAARAWDPTSLPDWLTDDVYAQQIQPALSFVGVATLVRALSISGTYATAVRKGHHRPHPRHWLKLAELVGVSGA